MKRFAVVLAAVSVLTLAFGGCSEDPWLGGIGREADSFQRSTNQNSTAEVRAHAPLDSYAKDGASTIGERTLIVVMVNFEDTPVENLLTEAYHKPQLTSRVFGAPNSVAALYNETSFGNLSYSGRVIGPYTIDMSHNSPCAERADMMERARMQAEMEHPDFSGFNYFMYVFPQPNECQDSGGFGGHASGVNLFIWTWESKSVIAHELGHTLGWGHSGESERGEYGDYSCIMSTSWHHNGFDLPLREARAIWKHEAGWLPPERVLTVDAVDSYEFYLAPAEREPGQIIDPPNGTAYQLLRIDYSDGNLETRSLYISYRRAEGTFYPVPAVADLMNRVHVSSFTTRYAVLEASASYERDAVRVKALTDSLGSEGDDYVKIAVDVLETPPGTSITPYIVRVADPPAGVVVGTVQLLITNNAVFKLSNTTYLLEPSIQQGFVVQPGVAAVTLGPGAATTVDIDLVTTASIYDGRLSYSVTVRDDSGVQGPSVASATLVADFDPPSVPSNLNHQSSLESVTLRWNASSDTWGVSHYEIDRNGQVIGTSPAFPSPSFVDYNIQPGVPYVYRVRAYDVPGHVSAWSSPYTVVADCNHGADSGVETPITYRATLPHRPFITPMKAYITNLNGAECGPAQFEYEVTNDGSDPSILPVPEGPAMITIDSGATVSGFGGMYFTVAPGEGAYVANIAIRQAGLTIASHTYTYVVDVTPPTTPSLVRANLVGTQVRLTWRGCTDTLSGLAHYEVLRDGVVVGQPTSAAFNDQLGSVSPGQMICYQVRAVDRAGNESPLSTTACVTIPNMEDPFVP